MGPLRKILVFILITSTLILLGRLAGRYLPSRGGHAGPNPAGEAREAGAAGDSTNALPDLVGDTSGGRWSEKLFLPLARTYSLPDKNIRRKTGYWEIIFPKGKPIHEYALAIEKTCARSGIKVLRGSELRPSNQGVEYHLESEGHAIKLRASLGKVFMAGSARLAIVFTRLDSLKETQLAALEDAPWEKTLIVDPYAGNPVLKKVRYTRPRNEVLAELRMEPSSYPYLDPGRKALYIHLGEEEVEKLVAEALDSLPGARGFASKYGDRAIENQPLLEKLFRQTVARNLIFLDLTGSPRSLTRGVAGGLGARYRISQVDKDSLGVAEELAGRAAVAQKTGEAVWVIAYSPEAFRGLEQAIAENESRMAETGLELVTLSRLSAPKGGPADPAQRAAKPPAAAAPGKPATKPETKPVAAPAAKPAPATSGKQAKGAPKKPVPDAKAPTRKPPKTAPTKSPPEKKAPPKSAPTKRP